MAKNYSLRAAASFSADEVRLLSELMSAVLRRDREFVDRAPGMASFTGIVGKVHAMKRRVESLKARRSRVAEVLAGEADRASLSEVELAELEVRERALRRKRPYRARRVGPCAVPSRSVTEKGRVQIQQKLEAESIRIEFIELVDGGASTAAAWEQLIKSHGNVHRLKQVLQADRLANTRSRLAVRQEAAE